MIRFLGSNKLKTAVFISGTGSNLENLIKFSLSRKSPIKISLIISNNSKAKGLKFSKQYKIGLITKEKSVKVVLPTFGAAAIPYIDFL